MKMQLTKKVEGTKLTIAVEGRLDTSTAPELEKEIEGSLDGITEMVLDFEKLDYLSSAGLRVMLYTHKIMSERNGLKMIHVNDVVREVFDVTGLADVLTIE